MLFSQLTTRTTSVGPSPSPTSVGTVVTTGFPVRSSFSRNIDTAWKLNVSNLEIPRIKRVVPRF